MIQLYKHNAETYETLKNMLKTENRIGAVQPTGTGKSFLILKYIEDNKDDDIIVLSPSNDIFNQFEEYCKETNDEDILKNVRMITYQKSIRFDDQELSNINADHIIIDEFHRTGSPEWGKYLTSIFDSNPDSKIFGVSATPVRYLDNARNMAEEIFYNNLAANITLGEAIQREILPTPDYVCVYYEDDNKYKLDIERINTIKDKKTREKMLSEYKQLIKNIQNTYCPEKLLKEKIPDGIGKFIVFCKDIDHIDECMKSIKKWFKNITTDIHFYKSISYDDDKDDQLELFKQDNSECV